MPVTTERFIVVEGSLSTHCCFEFTIVDTLYGKEDYDNTIWKKTMCEVFEEEDAALICDALNFYIKQS